MTDKPELGVISNQITSLSYAKSLAKIYLLAAESKYFGIHHWTNTGIAS